MKGKRQIMKKIKLLTTLSSLGVVAAATPIVATSCTTNSSLELVAEGLNDKVAIGGYMYAKFYLTLNGEMQTIKSVSAKSSNENIIVNFESEIEEIVYNYYADLTVRTIDGITEVGDKTTIDLEIVDVFENVVRKSINVEVVEPDVKVTDLVTYGNVHYGDATYQYEGSFYVTNAGNIVSNDYVNPITLKDDSKIYDSEDNNVTNAFNIDISMPYVTNGKFIFRILPKTDINPELGKYTLVFPVKNKKNNNEIISEESVDFELVNGFNWGYAGAVNTEYDNRNNTLYVNSGANDDASCSFTLAYFDPQYVSHIEYSFASTALEGITIDKKTGLINIDASIIQNLLTNVTVVAKIDGKIQAQLPIIIKSIF